MSCRSSRTSAKMPGPSPLEEGDSDTPRHSLRECGIAVEPVKSREPVRSIHGCCIPAKYLEYSSDNGSAFWRPSRRHHHWFPAPVPFSADIPRIALAEPVRENYYDVSPRTTPRNDKSLSILVLYPDSAPIVLRVTNTEYASSSFTSRTRRMYFRTGIAVRFMFTDEADTTALDQQIKTTAETDACVSASMSAPSQAHRVPMFCS